MLFNFSVGKMDIPFYVIVDEKTVKREYEREKETVRVKRGCVVFEVHYILEFIRFIRYLKRTAQPLNLYIMKYEVTSSL